MLQGGVIAQILRTTVSSDFVFTHSFFQIVRAQYAPMVVHNVFTVDVLIPLVSFLQR